MDIGDGIWFWQLMLFSLLARHLWIVQINFKIELEDLLYLSHRLLALKGVTSVGKLERWPYLLYIIKRTPLTRLLLVYGTGMLMWNLPVRRHFGSWSWGSCGNTVFTDGRMEHARLTGKAVVFRKRIRGYCTRGCFTLPKPNRLGFRLRKLLVSHSTRWYRWTSLNL